MNKNIYAEYSRYLVDPTGRLSDGSADVLMDPGPLNLDNKKYLEESADVLRDPGPLNLDNKKELEELEELKRLEEIESIKISERYIDFKSDFGFKFLLGKPNKKRLYHLIQSILASQIEVSEIKYGSTEILGKRKNNRTSHVDILCEEMHGRAKIILEMQNKRQEFFADRSILYSDQLNSSLARKGADWDYDTDPIIIICYMNFTIRKDHPGYIHFGRLMFEDVLDGCTANPYISEKKLFCFVELGKFNKKITELETDLDKWLFLIKNLSSLSEIPEIFNNKIFKPIFESAEYSKMSEENKMLYKEDINLEEKWLENANMGGLLAQTREDAIAEVKPIFLEEGIEVGMKKGIEKGLEKGLEKGKKEGIEEGMKKNRDNTIRSIVPALLKDPNYTSQKISKLLKIPLSLVEEIKNK